MTASLLLDQTYLSMDDTEVWQGVLAVEADGTAKIKAIKQKFSDSTQKKNFCSAICKIIVAEKPSRECSPGSLEAQGDRERFAHNLIEPGNWGT